jgi:hypothetical protein
MINSGIMKSAATSIGTSKRRAILSLRSSIARWFSSRPAPSW